MDLARGDASRDFSREEKQKERMSEIFSLAEGKDSRIACGPLVRVIRERWACIFARFIPEEEGGRADALLFRIYRIYRVKLTREA